MSEPVSDVDLWVEFPGYLSPEVYVWPWDQLPLKMDSGDGEETWYYTCLDSLFLLYHHLELGESGSIPMDSGLLDVEVGEEVSFGEDPELVGSVAEFRAAVEPLIADILRELESEGKDVEAICTKEMHMVAELAFDRVAMWERLVAE